MSRNNNMLDSRAYLQHRFEEKVILMVVRYQDIVNLIRKFVVRIARESLS